MRNTYEYTGINSSTTVSLNTGEDLTNVAGKAVKLTADGVILPAAGEEPVGIALITEDEEIYKKGKDITVQVKDIGFWRAGGEIDAGDPLAADANGLCQKATDGQYVYARALNSATAEGDLVTVQIINAGYAKTTV